MPKPFERFIASGCWHGELVDRDAWAAMMGFAGRYKAKTRVCLGDVGDYAAFRAGARGTPDEFRQLGPDIRTTSDLILEYRPTHLILGNHDIRIFKQAESHNAIVALAAGQARNAFLTAVNKAKVKVFVDSYDIRKSKFMLGDTKCTHGFMYGENAVRDHAEHFGKVLFAHLHTAGMARGRRDDSARGACVGTLANIGLMDYANTRRSTSRWSHGLVWGEYNDKECHFWLADGDAETPGAWRMPF